MKKFMLTMALAGLVATAGFSRAEAADARATAMAAPDEKVAKGYDLKPQALLDLKELQKKYADLAGAIPQDKYTWRPGPGVRSVSETLLHVTQANYFIVSLLGIPRPAGTDAKDFETSTTDKAKIIDELNKSFAFAEEQVEKLTSADLAKPVPKMGPEANEGYVVLLLVTHCHEHLGQMIAYARVNGVVPPWTAAAQAKQAPKD